MQPTSPSSAIPHPPSSPTSQEAPFIAHNVIKILSTDFEKYAQGFEQFVSGGFNVHVNSLKNAADHISRSQMTIEPEVLARIQSSLATIKEMTERAIATAATLRPAQTPADDDQKAANS